jgi:hypothetical protein
MTAGLRTASLINRVKANLRDLATVSARSLSPRYFGLRSQADVLLPSILIIGAQRAGTTSLHEYLSRHPQLFASKRKEVHYFDIGYSKGARWYQSNFPSRKSVEREAGNAPCHSFETTPYYLYHPLAPERATRLLPQAKIIALFRDPIARAYSHYQNEIRKGYERLSFADAIAAESERLDREEQKLRDDPTYYSYNHQHYSYVDRGRYDLQLERWLKFFPRQQFLFIRSEDLFEHPGKTLDSVASFLGLPPFPAQEFDRLNASNRPAKISDELREQLRRKFSPHNARLAEITALRLDWQ